MQFRMDGDVNVICPPQHVLHDTFRNFHSFLSLALRLFGMGNKEFRVFWSVMSYSHMRT